MKLLKMFVAVSVLMMAFAAPTFAATPKKVPHLSSGLRLNPPKDDIG